MSAPAHPSSGPPSTPAALLRLGPIVFLLLWSLGFPIAKIGIAHAGPLTILALRYGLVLVLLVPVFLWRRPPLPASRREWLDLLVVGFLIQCGYFGLCYLAFLLGTSAGTVALIVSLQPILVALLAPMTVGERTDQRGWLGLTLGFIGAALVILGRSGGESLPVGGVICAVGGLASMTLATLYERRYGRHQHPVTANLVHYAVGALFTLPPALVVEQLHARWDGAFIAVLAYLVIGNSLVAITLLLAMIRHGRAAQVSALFYLVPPCATLLAWGLIGERMPMLAWAGMAVAAAGVALVTLRRPQPPQG